MLDHLKADSDVEWSGEGKFFGALNAEFYTRAGGVRATVGDSFFALVYRGNSPRTLSEDVRAIPCPTTNIKNGFPFDKLPGIPVCKRVPLVRETDFSRFGRDHPLTAIDQCRRA
jgi:hypothetical protein